MPVVISDPELKQLNMDEGKFRIELAVHFYKNGKFSLAQASQFADLSRLDFQKELSDRRVDIKYDVADLHDDLQTLRRLKKAR